LDQPQGNNKDVLEYAATRFACHQNRRRLRIRKCLLSEPLDKAVGYSHHQYIREET
jgi:hypothetical protein